MDDLLKEAIRRWLIKAQHDLTAARSPGEMMRFVKRKLATE